MVAWQTPKTDWTPPDGVTDTDFNRIEGNIAHIGGSGIGASATTAVTVTDANALDTTGFYVTNSDWIGSPMAGINGGNQGNLEHIQWSNPAYATQIHTQINNSLARRYRHKDNGAWTAWVTIETTAGAQAKANAVNTTQVNYIPINSKTNASLLATFLDGVTVMQATSSTGGFPSIYGTLTTHKAVGYGYQTFTTGSTGAQTWKRAFDPNNTIWLQWNEIETVAGSQAKATAAVKPVWTAISMLNGWTVQRSAGYAVIGNLLMLRGQISGTRGVVCGRVPSQYTPQFGAKVMVGTQGTTGFSFLVVNPNGDLVIDQLLSNNDAAVGGYYIDVAVPID